MPPFPKLEMLSKCNPPTGLASLFQNEPKVANKKQRLLAQASSLIYSEILSKLNFSIKQRTTLVGAWFLECRDLDWIQTNLVSIFISVS